MSAIVDNGSVGGITCRAFKHGIVMLEQRDVG